VTKYYNTKTRAIIDSPLVISGENWIKYEDKDQVEETETAIVDEVVEEVEEKEIKKPSAGKKITKADIENELEALGVEYDKKATKDELYTLLMEQ
jgi:hypothetical protein